MLTIYKYPLQVPDTQPLSMPRGAKLLHVGLQRGDFTLWALVESSLPQRRRQIACYGTGHPIAEGALGPGEYIGTVMNQSETLVWHFFDAGEE